MPKVLVSDPIAEAGIALLRQIPNTQVDVKLGLKPEELKAIIGEYDALAVRSETKVTAEILAEAKNLQIIGRAGVGVDNIDVALATQKGIVVVNSPEGNTLAAAELAVALLAWPLPAKFRKPMPVCVPANGSAKSSSEPRFTAKPSASSGLAKSGAVWRSV